MSERVYAFCPVFEAPGFDAVGLDQAAKEVEHLFEELADKGGHGPRDLLDGGVPSGLRQPLKERPCRL